MQRDQARGVGEVVAFAEEARRGGDVMQVVRVDRGGGVIVFGFDERVGEGGGELAELWAWKATRDEEGGCEGFLPEVREAVGCAGGGVVEEVFVCC